MRIPPIGACIWTRASNRERYGPVECALLFHPTLCDKPLASVREWGLPYSATALINGAFLSRMRRISSRLTSGVSNNTR
jgi:hypothetical protein